MQNTCTVKRTCNVPRLSVLCISLLLLMGLSEPALAASGDLDLSFSNNGKVTTLMGSSSMGHAAVAQSVAIQADGMIVAAGQVGGGLTERFALARYQTNGNLDLNFSGDGMVTTPFGSLAGATSVAIYPSVSQPTDGMIVVAGWKLSGSNTRFALARYQTNGTLDPTFGVNGNGKVTTPIGANSGVTSVAIQSDGMIVVAGNGRIANNTGFALARYQTNGTLDTTFGSSGNGKVHTLIGQYAEASSVAIQSDGMIVAAGYSSGVSSSRFALARYQTNGTLDTGFGVIGNGTIRTPFGSPSTAGATSVAIQPSGGEVVAVGYSSSGNSTRFALARYLSNGTPDPSFGINADGKVTTAMGPYSEARSISIQPSDGKLVVAGNALQANKGVFAVARYDLATGSLDTTFGNNGKVKTLIGNSAYGSSVAIQPTDGKIVVAGQGSGGIHFRFAVARYDP